MPDGFEHEFLRRTDFITTPEFKDIEKQQLLALARIATSPAPTYELLWNAVDRAGARIPIATSRADAADGVITRRDVEAILREAGSTLAPTASQAQLIQNLKVLSRVGRSWRRSIGNETLERAATTVVTDALSTGTRSVLLTGGPGSGKSCVLLDVTERIEREARACCVYVQGRTFSAAQSAAEREARGLPPDLVQQIARLAEFQPVVVVFDSLDVLSLGREHGALGFFLALMDQLLAINGVAVVAAARSFDAKYDSSLATRTWGLELDLADLDWDLEVKPLLVAWTVDEVTLPTELKALLRNPRHLALFHDIQARGTIPAARSHHELTRSYLDICIRGEPAMGSAAVDRLEDIAGQMLYTRALEVSIARANLNPAMEAALCSAGALQRTDRGNLEFAHQTLLDVLAIGAWERKRGTLSTFIDELPHVPFVRPAIRAYVLHLGALNRRALRVQLRGLIASGSPHHIKRLLVETFADLVPEDDDWPFLNALRPYGSLFAALFGRADTVAWKDFWLRHLAPLAFAEHLEPHLLSLTRKLADSLPYNTGPVLEFWQQVLRQDWLAKSGAAWAIGFALSEHLQSAHEAVQPLIQLLMLQEKQEHDSLGGAMMRAVELGAITDDLLWEYITKGVDEDALKSYAFEGALRCEPHVFGEGNRLANLMVESDRLLDLAIDTLDYWMLLIEQQYQADGPWHENFLIYSSWDFAHTNYDHHDVSSVHILFRAIEAGVLARCDSDAPWWRANCHRLAQSRDGAQRYWCVSGIYRRPEANTNLAAALGQQERMLTYSLSHEVGEMLKVSYALMDETQQAAITHAIATIPVRAAGPHDWFDRIQRAKMIKAIPAGGRPHVLQTEIDDVERNCGTVHCLPDIRASGGMVDAPFHFQRFLEASDDNVIRLLSHYDADDHELRIWGEMIGGSDEVGSQLQEASSRAPSRFLALLKNHFYAIPDRFRPRVLDGVQLWTQRSSGSMQKQSDWVSLEDEKAANIAELMLDELERHSIQWRGTREAANALRAAASVLPPVHVHRLAFQLFGFLRAPYPASLNDLITTGINSTGGNAAESATIAAIHCLEAGQLLPDILLSALTQFAAHPHPSVRAVILRRLPYFTSRNMEMGWALFSSCVYDDHPELWVLAEQCLYFAYGKDFPRIKPILARMLAAADRPATAVAAKPDAAARVLESWARISTLASLAGHISYPELMQGLRDIDSSRAWHGALSVWSANAHMPQHHDTCFSGLRLALEIPVARAHAAHAMDRVFRNSSSTVVPVDVIALKFEVLRHSERTSSTYHSHQFPLWLEAISVGRPDDALVALELLIAFITNERLSLQDGRPLARALTTLFREAEERESWDGGLMLQRLVTAQDGLLTAGAYGLDDWLRSAERP